MILATLSVCLLVPPAQTDADLTDRLGGKRNAVVLGGGGADTEDAVLASLKWLSRHQHDNGTWNAAKVADRCGRLEKYGKVKCTADYAPDPADVKADPAPLTAEEKAKLTTLSAQLSGTIEQRDAAARELVALGPRALDLLRTKAEGETDPEAKARLQSVVDTIVVRSAREGDIVVSTSLALLAFLGAGYSPLSKDTHDGICFGDVVRKGLEALVKAQGEDGFIGSKETARSVMAHALATQVLVEGWGLIGDLDLKAKAQSALKALASRQLGDGSFPAGGKAERDAASTIAAAWALYGAHAVELEPGQAFERLAGWVPAEPPKDRAQLAAAATAALLVDRKASERVKKLAAAAREIGVSADESPLVTMALSQVVFHVEGPEGEGWKEWNQRLKDVLVPSQKARAAGCPCGSWTPPDAGKRLGRVGAAALGAMSAETYYRWRRIEEKRKGE